MVGVGAGLVCPEQEAMEINKLLSTPKFVLEAMARSISPDIFKTFTARYTKDIALEVSIATVIQTIGGYGR